MNSFKKMIMMANQIDDKPSLPNGYLELKSIYQINGSIYTGIAGNDDALAFEIKCRWNTYVKYGTIFGNYASETANSWRILLDSTNNGYILYNANWASNKAVAGKTDNDKCHTYYLSRDRITYDSVDVDFEVGEKGDVINSYISIANSNINLRIEYFKAWRDGVMIFNGIPALRLEDNVAGLYDAVNNRFIKPTGSFIAEYKYEIPSEYKELSYIQCSNGSYINTGIAGDTDDLELEIECKWSKYLQYARIINNYSGEDSNRWRIILNTTNQILLDYNTAANNAHSCTMGNGYIYNLSYKRFGVNWVYTEKSGTKKSIINNNPITIGQTDGREIELKAYRFKGKKDGELVRDLIPVIRLADSKPGMYDLVSGQFLTNQGTGEFTYG
jgi:hypothetical protein